jgi:hypothetical protein
VSVHADTIGDIVESTGVGAIFRSNEEIPSSTNLGINLYDEAKTQNGRMLIEFLDEEELALTEHTIVYIDEAYYDPDPSKSKMAIRMARGTARFASGAGNKIKKRNISVTTPTAQIAINGTDFTTTIDELGRSLVVLLPDAFGDASGEIVVSNEGGQVTLTEAYSATMVSSLSTPPTPTVTIQNVTPSMIDNMFIVNPPKEVSDAIQEQAQDDLDQDQGLLDVDFLEFNDLEQDALEDTGGDLEYSALDVDFLDVDFLVDLLDVVEELVKTTKQLADQQETSGDSGEFVIKGANFGKNDDSQYNVFIEDGGIVFYRDVNGVISLKFAAGANITLDTIVDGYEGIITTNSGDSIDVRIRQVN